MMGGACETAQVGDECFKEVSWAMLSGIHEHPEWYEHLTTWSSFTDFQRSLHEKGRGGCSQPCPGPGISKAQLKELQRAEAGDPNGLQEMELTTEPGSSGVMKGPCLCLFDVDRTLTSKQGFADKCPGSEVHKGVEDPAFGGGDLVISPVGANMEETPCNKCKLGVISQGQVGGADEKKIVMSGLQDVGTIWSKPDHVVSPLVHGCPDSEKPKCAQSIVKWYATEVDVHILPKNVFFFDDQDGNVDGFAQLGYNAKQISCTSRDEGMRNSVGICGAQLNEIFLKQGIQRCEPDFY